MLEPYVNDYLKIGEISLPDDPEGKRLLVLDIDETMIHTIDERDPPNMLG
jgi:hypothetical protein